METLGSACGQPLVGQTAVVTGGTEGIGLAVARGLGRRGANVVVSSRRPDAVADVERHLAEQGVTALGIPADVREESDVRHLVGAASDAFGGVEILVNSAGGSFGDSFDRGPVFELTPQDFLEAYRLNVVGTFICARAVIPVMQRNGAGSIVNISSVAAYSPPSGMAAYGATKAAINNLTKSMAVELAPVIRVNAVAPGYIDTPRTSARRDPERRARQLSEIPMNRFGTPEDVAAAVLFLASPSASWMTGEVIRLDGGACG